MSFNQPKLKQTNQREHDAEYLMHTYRRTADICM